MIYSRRKSNNVFANLQHNAGSFAVENKSWLIITFAFLLVGILTGVFTAIKFNNGAVINFDDFSIVQFISGKLGSANLFFSRMFSYEIVLVIITICSFNIFIIPINLFVIAYRSYLLGLNCTLIIILFGLGGIICTILIILPMQLIIMALIALYSCLSSRRAIYVHRYGKVQKDNFIILLLWFTLIITVVNLAETILLTIFSGRIILVL